MMIWTLVLNLMDPHGTRKVCTPNLCFHISFVWSFCSGKFCSENTKNMLLRRKDCLMMTLTLILTLIVPVDVFWPSRFEFTKKITSQTFKTVRPPCEVSKLQGPPRPPPDVYPGSESGFWVILFSYVLIISLCIVAFEMSVYYHFWSWFDCSLMCILIFKYLNQVYRESRIQQLWLPTVKAIGIQLMYQRLFQVNCLTKVIELNRKRSGEVNCSG